MEILEIKQNKRFFFDDEISIITDKNKISFKAEWGKELIERLNKTLKGFKIESKNDFSRLREKLNFLDLDKYSILEKAVVSNIKNAWKFMNPNVRQVPRPMSLVLNKKTGIKEFFTFSINTRSFDSSLEANRHIQDYINKKIKDKEEMKEEDILMLLKEAVDKEHELTDFEIRIGIVFNNYENGKYVYKDKELNSEEQLKFAAKLIEDYSAAYLENPFIESDIDSYKKLSSKYQKHCLICVKSKINEYAKLVNEKAVNTVIVKFENMSLFDSEVKHLKENKINIIIEDDIDPADIAVSLEIPLIKLEDSTLKNKAVRRIYDISDEIIDNKIEKPQAI